MTNERLKTCRERMNLSLPYVANVLKLTLNELEQVEQGVRQPTDEQWNMIEKLYGCSRTYFLKEVTPQPFKELTDHDAKQVQEFFAFQQQLSRKK